MRMTPLGACASAALLRNTPTQKRPIKGEYRIDASLKAVQNMACFAVSVTEPIAKSECHRRAFNTSTVRALKVSRQHVGPLRRLASLSPQADFLSHGPAVFSHGAVMLCESI